jgi:uncharacterized protein YdhG (YjbR/CyaY superfamily)
MKPEAQHFVLFAMPMFKNQANIAVVVISNSKFIYFLF